MLQINPMTLAEVAAERGWLHTRGRLSGTVNTTAMAQGIGVATSTLTRAYDGSAAGPVLIERLRTATGRSFDDLVRIVPDERNAA